MKQLILLHGAIGAKDQMQPLAALLGQSANVHNLGFPGHGNEPMATQPLSVPMLVAFVSHYIHKHQLENVTIVGYSMGGYVAMCLAQQFPHTIHKIITLGTKFYWDKAVVAKEIQQLQPNIIEQKVPAFAAQLNQRHTATDWKQLLQQTAGLITNLGNDNLLALDRLGDYRTPTLLLLGDRDKMITLEETVAIYKQLPFAQMAVLPNTPHPIEQVNLPLLSFIIQQFLA
jgi:pimeloyl-ACP methyl ester carboxylesterase